MMIKKTGTSTFTALLLLLALGFGSVAPVCAQGTTGRERRVSTTQSASAPQQTPTPKPTPGQTPTPTPTQQAASSPALKERKPAAKTVEELRARIEEVLRNPELESAQMAVKVASLDTGRTLFEE